MATVRKGPSEAALEKFTNQFAKSFGAGAMTISPKVEPYKVISTGSLEFDFALGCGGIVVGSLFEIWGVDGSGKTSLSLIQIAQAQKAYPARMAAFIDMEHKLDRSWAVKLGVDLSRLIHIEPDDAEDVADQMKDLITSDLVSIVVLDSIGGMVNREEKEKDAEQRSVGTTPGIITRMVKIAASEAKRHGVAVYLINQVRANLGYGADSVAGGGFARAHATLHRVKARRASGQPLTVGSGTDAVQVGFKVALKVEKNGVSSPGRTAIVTIINQPSAKYGQTIGIADLENEAFSVGKKAGVIARAGANYTFPNGFEVKGGEEKAIEALRADPKLFADLRKHVIKAAEGSVDESAAGEVESTEDDSDDDF